MITSINAWTMRFTHYVKTDFSECFLSLANSFTQANKLQYYIAASQTNK